MSNQSIEEILFNLNNQLVGFMEDIETKGVNLILIGEIIEHLVNETSKLKTVMLECVPSKDLH